MNLKKILVLTFLAFKLNATLNFARLNVEINGILSSKNQAGIVNSKLFIVLHELKNSVIFLNPSQITSVDKNTRHVSFENNIGLGIRHKFNSNLMFGLSGFYNAKNSVVTLGELKKSHVALKSLVCASELFYKDDLEVRFNGYFSGPFFNNEYHLHGEKRNENPSKINVDINKQIITGRIAVTNDDTIRQLDGAELEIMFTTRKIIKNSFVGASLFKFGNKKQTYKGIEVKLRYIINNFFVLKASYEFNNKKTKLIKIKLATNLISVGKKAHNKSKLDTKFYDFVETRSDFQNTIVEKEEKEEKEEDKSISNASILQPFSEIIELYKNSYLSSTLGLLYKSTFDSLNEAMMVNINKLADNNLRATIDYIDSSLKFALIELNTMIQTDDIDKYKKSFIDSNLQDQKNAMALIEVRLADNPASNMTLSEIEQTFTQYASSKKILEEKNKVDLGKLTLKLQEVISELTIDSKRTSEQVLRENHLLINLDPQNNEDKEYLIHKSPSFNEGLEELRALIKKLDLESISNLHRYTRDTINGELASAKIIKDAFNKLNPNSKIIEKIEKLSQSIQTQITNAITNPINSADDNKNKTVFKYGNDYYVIFDFEDGLLKLNDLGDIKELSEFKNIDGKYKIKIENFLEKDKETYFLVDIKGKEASDNAERKSALRKSFYTFLITSIMKETHSNISLAAWTSKELAANPDYIKQVKEKITSIRQDFEIFCKDFFEGQDDKPKENYIQYGYTEGSNIIDRDSTSNYINEIMLDDPISRSLMSNVYRDISRLFKAFVDMALKTKVKEIEVMKQDNFKSLRESLAEGKEKVLEDITTRLGK
jgi:hypothetical protein